MKYYVIRDTDEVLSAINSTARVCKEDFSDAELNTPNFIQEGPFTRPLAELKAAIWVARGCKKYEKKEGEL
jgi:hypothetical protein